MIFMTADEHYGHANILKFCKRPFDSVEEMDQALIDNHNERVSKDDTTIHAGDFTLKSKEFATSIIKQLNGSHTFLKGSHDYWLPQNHKVRIEQKFNGYFIVIDHYCMRTWARSHFNSIHLFGHSHNKLESIGKSMDIGVDTNNYYPYSLDEIINIMKTKPDNFNLVKRR